MSRDKLILVGVVILGLLGYLVYRENKIDEGLGHAAAGSKDFPTISVSDDFDRISITNGDKPEIVLEKVPDPKGTASPDGGAPTVWQLSKPVSAPANQSTIKDLTNNLRDLKIVEQVNLKLDDEVRKDKQLDAAHGLHIVVAKGAEKKLDATFGKAGAQSNTLVMVADRPDIVWAAKGFQSHQYAKEPKEFRNKEILKLDDANASQVTIANTHGTFSFTKGDHWAASFDKNPLPKFDEDKVKDLLKQYKALNADDFGDGKSLADTGLDRPDATVTIQLKDNAARYEILVGKTATGSNRWAKRGDDDTIFQITPLSADWATADVPKFQAAADGGAGDGGSKPAPAPAGSAPKHHP
jgi:hypothetical protein